MGKVGAPKENVNAEKWTFEEAESFMISALELSANKERDYDFIGEIARELGQYKEIFSYLVGKFPDLKSIQNRIISNCEANCFYNGKTSKIVPSLAIMNLKSNHGWTDRVDNTTKGEKINNAPLTPEELKERKSKIDDQL